MCGLSHERLLELFNYDPETGVLQRRSGKKTGWNQNGYVMLSIDSKKYLAHRVIWFYVHGNWPENDIDHINQVKNDNRIANLREVYKSQNMRNQARFRGYHLHKGSGLWRAQYALYNKVYHIGLFKTESEAREAYLSKVASLN
jgi:hypothetical protein